MVDDDLEQIQRLEPKQRFIQTIFDLDSISSQASLNFVPWTDLNWELAKGTIADRYNDQKFRRANCWQKRKEYISQKDFRKIINAPKWLQKSRVNKLSPAEKYDLLVGDFDRTLTFALWDDVEKIHYREGVEAWMGLCEGTTAAALVFPEPKKSVFMTSARNGISIEFTPTDIKALAGLLYSDYVAGLPTIGTRCIHRDLDRDRKDCFDINPASWHVAVLSFIGKFKKPFVTDTVKNYIVQSSTILGYELIYYNPSSKQSSHRASEVMMERAKIHHDPFHSRRSPHAKYLLGVNMRAFTSVQPTYEVRGQNPALKKIGLDLIYDLEIDSFGKIIGGEWHNLDNKGPDFIWSIPNGFRSLSLADKSIDLNPQWNGERVPLEWVDSIRSASAQCQPMAIIVERLIEMSTH